ncbi:MAG: hypothetical protein HDKAJFGB_04207 [Anaerolineae bacterium]|nr:hypothetical protein [Anaerolineae bacterium]
MSEDIYGHEESFYKGVKSEGDEWRRKEFVKWLENAKKNIQANLYGIAIDDMLDALCYDSRVSVIEALVSTFEMGPINEAIRRALGALVKYILETNGKYDLEHVRRVANLQHLWREQRMGFNTSDEEW